MKRVSWISCDSFIDTDLPAVQRLQKRYIIKLIIIITTESTINYEKMVGDILQKGVSEAHFFYLKHRFRSLLNIKEYIEIINLARADNPDLYYISFQGIPYAPIIYRMLLPSNKCVAACHNVTTPKGATNEKLAKKTTRFWLNSFKNINVFSLFQASALQRDYPSKRIMITPFYLKYYGPPSFKSDKLSSNKIRFLVFGNIIKYKRIDLLINAANILYDRGIKSFVIKIAGNCKNWGYYQKMIKHVELFELKIGRIPNEDVPNLFADSHYAVFPYQDIAQSGSINVAFSYNVPTIVSNIEQFKEFVVDRQTSLSFECGSAESLANTMQYAISHHHEIYPKLCKQQKEYVNKAYSESAITNKYIDFFESL